MIGGFVYFDYIKVSFCLILSLGICSYLITSLGSSLSEPFPYLLPLSLFFCHYLEPLLAMSCFGFELWFRKMLNIVCQFMPSKNLLFFFFNYFSCNCTFFPQHIGIITTCFLFQTDEFIPLIFVFTSIFSRSFLSALVRFLSSRFYDIFLGCQGFSFHYDISYHFFFVHNINKLLIVCSENLVFIA